MERNLHKQNSIIRIVCVILVAIMILPTQVSAQERQNSEKLRVGFFAFDGYHNVDEDGCKSGYGYEFIQKILQYNNYTVEYIGYEKNWSEMQEMLENGAIGVDTFSKSSPYEYDAILMDIRMPVMDGIEATKQIRNLDREDAKQIPIVAMTANAFSDDVKQTMEAGMNAHLSKPIEVEKLYQILENTMKEKLNKDVRERK